jgi:ubiquinol-cytochrome c reductase iron-sulfur subunit
MTALDDTSELRNHHSSQPTRRDFLTIVTGSFGAVGGATTLWPLIDQMNPNPGSPAGTVVVDLAPILPGQAITVAWRSQPVVIRHRTPDEIALARAVAAAGLPDPYARNAALPELASATDANRTRGRPEWLVVVAVCTHLGCGLKPADIVGRGEGWFCPCHAAQFDLSGRVRSGPARTNLPVPPYRFVTRNAIEIGRT